MTKKQFVRRVSGMFSKLGRKRKKKQTWRRPTGRDNKMREKRKGRPSIVSIGYGKDSRIRGTIREKKPVVVRNILDLNKIGKDEIGIVGKIGTRKKIEIANKAKEMQIELSNLNPNKFLKKNKLKVKEKKTK